MVDAFISTTTQSNLVAGAVDRYVRAALRHSPLLRNVADTRPVQINMPGDTVSLYTYSDLAPATTPLNETSDPDAVALGDPTATTITLNEYGLATVSTVRLANMAFSDIDPNQMDQVAYSLRNTLDVLVRDVLSGGTNERFSGSATDTDEVTAAMTLGSDDIRYVVAKLRSAAAQGRRGELYWCGVHPDVAHDLKAETGAGSWRDSHVYAAPDLIWPNEIGVYEGCFFVESARMKVATDGLSSASVFRTIVAGKEALAEAVAKEPRVEIGVYPDKLNRFFPMGWHGILGWSLFRQEAIYNIQSGSSITA